MQCLVDFSTFNIIMLLFYDGLATSILTGLFLWPLWRGAGLSLELRKVATRTVM